MVCGVCFLRKTAGDSRRHNSNLNESGMNELASVRGEPMTKESADATREELRALLAFPKPDLQDDYSDDKAFQLRAAKIIGVLPGKRLRLWEL